MNPASLKIRLTFVAILTCYLVLVGSISAAAQEGTADSQMKSETSVWTKSDIESLFVSHRVQYDESCNGAVQGCRDLVNRLATGSFDELVPLHGQPPSISGHLDACARKLLISEFASPSLSLGKLDITNARPAIWYAIPRRWATPKRTKMLQLEDWRSHGRLVFDGLFFVMNNTCRVDVMLQFFKRNPLNPQAADDAGEHGKSAVPIVMADSLFLFSAYRAQPDGSPATTVIRLDTALRGSQSVTYSFTVE